MEHFIRITALCAFILSGCAGDGLPVIEEPAPVMPDAGTVDASKNAPDLLNPLKIEVRQSPEKYPTQIVVARDHSFGTLKNPTFVEVSVANGSDVPVVITGAKIRQINGLGDVKDCEEVMLTWAASTLTSANTTNGDVWETSNVNGDAVQIEPKQSWLVKVVCRVAVPLPFSAVAGAWYGVPRSGHTPQLRLDEITVKSAVDNRTATLKPMIAGEPMLLRKSVPLINAYPSRKPLSGNGTGSLYTETVVARGWHVAIKHREITFERLPGSDFTVSDLVLLRNGIPVDPQTYSMSFYVDPNRHGLQVMPNDVGAAALYIEFHGEEIVQHATVYELQGTVDGAKKGDWLKIYSWASQNQTRQMGQILPMRYGSYLLQLGIGTPPTYAGHVFWSDMSEFPHSDQVFPRGSNDWLTDYLVTPDPEQVTLSF